MEIPSVSGEEQAVGEFLREYLSALGYEVDMQDVVDGRCNVIATASDEPHVFLSTHMDTVPPHIPQTEDDEKIYGRGSCDAKGIIAAQITAAEELRASGESRLGLLFTIDEEAASLGSRAANDLPVAKKCRYLINGEPTDNDLAVGSKGSLRMTLRTSGKAAHSAYPEMGESAIDKLVGILHDLRSLELPSDEFFGETTLNVGTIGGGVATNVIAPSAEAGLHIRLTTDDGPIIEALKGAVAGRGEMETMSCSLPVRMLAVNGFNQKVVRFTTDIPQLTKWGTPLLLGPGSILDAHTKHEFVLKKDLETAVAQYVNLTRILLAKEN
jgi:acetylornithine deacetylase